MSVDGNPKVERSLPKLVSDLAKDMSTLVRKELQLAKMKTKEDKTVSHQSERASSSSASGKKRPAYHVTPHESGWKTIKEGDDRPVATGARKDEVVEKARRQARKEQGQLIIHKRDGKIQEERTYGSDPSSSKG